MQCHPIGDKLDLDMLFIIAPGAIFHTGGRVAGWAGSKHLFNFLKSHARFYFIILLYEYIFKI